MANQQTQQPSGGKQQIQRREPTAPAVPDRGFAPMRDAMDMMRDLVGWDPFRAFPMMRDPFRMMRRMMRDMMAVAPEEMRDVAWRPAFDVRETDDAYLVCGDVPGLSADELDVSLVGNRLRISGAREHEAEHALGEARAVERAYGSFTRTFELPDDVATDDIRCSLEHGVLQIALPKQAGAKPRRKIEIASGAGGNGHGATKERAQAAQPSASSQAKPSA